MSLLINSIKTELLHSATIALTNYYYHDVILPSIVFAQTVVYAT